MTKPPNSTSKARANADDAAQPSEDSRSFEELLEDVESIIERIEAGEVGLEQSLQDYERGIKLLNQCRSRLAAAKQKVIDLTSVLNQADGGDAGSQG
jgi:exodeoxyribonuclease VII small subunit